jgi:isoamylase
VNVPDASWTNPEHRLLCLRRATRNGDGTVSILTFLLNPTGEDRSFQLPEPALPGQILVDTARPEAEVIELKEKKVNVQPHSAVLVYSNLEPAPP